MDDKERLNRQIVALWEPLNDYLRHPLLMNGYRVEQGMILFEGYDRHETKDSYRRFRSVDYAESDQESSFHGEPYKVRRIEDNVTELKVNREYDGKRVIDLEVPPMGHLDLDITRYLRGVNGDAYLHAERLDENVLRLTITDEAKRAEEANFVGQFNCMRLGHVSEAIAGRQITLVPEKGNEFYLPAADAQKQRLLAYVGGRYVIRTQD
jgi:hypothetical protein